VKRAAVVALLGAESTGKTTLAAELGAALQAEGYSVAVVAEYLREFCDRQGRTPRVDEQRAIADEQTLRIQTASQHRDVVIADTTALMIAVYSHHVFGDTSLYVHALAAHQHCSLTLLTALDLPWQADGLQRDGPQVRAPVDALVRAALLQANAPFSVVFGSGRARLQAALGSVHRTLRPPAITDATARWTWVCDRCGDAACEQHRLPRF
jgi:nicotinamide riboside kinase